MLLHAERLELQSHLSPINFVIPLSLEHCIIIFVQYLNSNKKPQPYKMEFKKISVKEHSRTKHFDKIFP